MREPLTPLDACWLHVEAADNPMMITAVLEFTAPVAFADLLALFQDRLVERYPRFTRRVVEPGPGIPPMWTDDPDFDLRRHVHRLGLPPPAGQPELQELVSDLMSTQLDLRRPPWEIHVVEGFDEGFAMVVRVHHCVADGISLARVLLSLADAPPPVKVEARHRGSTFRERLSRARQLASKAVQVSVDALLHPGRVAQWVVEETDSAVRLLTLPPDPDTPLRGALTPRKRCAWAGPLPLAPIKQAGRARGATINDVLLATLAGALRSWLQERSALVDGVRVFVPVNLRPLDEPVDAGLGNAFSLVVAELPIGLPTAAERLASVQHRMEELKRSHDPEVVYALLHALGATPRTVEGWLVDFLARKATAIVTNVPGPREPMTMAGARLSGVLVWVPQSGDVSLGVSLFSYAGEIFVGVATDAGIVDNPSEIVDRFVTELDVVMAS